MKKKFDAVVFDLDGTILDTTEGILAALEYTMKESCLLIPTEDVLKSFIGPPIEYSFKKLYDLDDKDVERLAATFRKRYKSYELLKAKPYDGIYEVFEHLHKNGIKTSIATYKRESYARTLLKHFEFDRFTDVIHGADTKGVLRKRDIIEICLKNMDVTEYSRVVMIGDSDNDAIGAAEIGTAFAGVTYGFGFSDSSDLKNFESVGIVDNPIDLIDLFL